MWKRSIAAVFDGVGDADDRSAFQLAVWELVYDNGVVNLGAGDLWADNTTSNLVFERANAFLADALANQGSSQARASLIVFSNEKDARQDQIAEYIPPPHENSPVPEPTTAVIWTLILGIAGVI